ncbi:hypothetical protein PF005_g20009 [Phytophthora fragariae]|uniref:Uncharacterized protein n=1 Tax=Phytophthora fragariae TaxID=53985 RepID=A0A6A3IYT0_9STRA|nr:hypothetical protein PF003_g38132 [Phytophthora fragariae]KAE8931248.1 hypothetical protein PF009_g18686 [Phytophthora fragariae]KAE8987042.1 hypothetical protein PF011_g19734 [Phytophthora fragariae]KAE9094812.1 hypothetical protein PF010_g16950 [Phytophthora fragariae]KAE9095189.1 hypothetical protein PF007_g17465 [Phytophthora fragariae]
MTELQVRTPARGQAGRPTQTQYTYSDEEDDPSDHGYSDDDRGIRDDEELYDSEEERDHVAAASEQERRAAADGTFAGQTTDLAVGVTLGEGSTVVTGLSTGTTVTTGLVSTDHKRHVGEPDTRLTTATAAANCANKCTTLASARPFKLLGSNEGREERPHT